MTQTAVEWLYERLERMIPRTPLYNMDKEQYFKQAKEVERQQIEDAANSENSVDINHGEQYYNETFKNK